MPPEKVLGFPQFFSNLVYLSRYSSLTPCFGPRNGLLNTVLKLTFSIVFENWPVRLQKSSGIFCVFLWLVHELFGHLTCSDACPCWKNCTHYGYVYLYLYRYNKAYCICSDTAEKIEINIDLAGTGYPMEGSTGVASFHG